MATSRTKKVTPEEVSAAYGEVAEKTSNGTTMFTPETCIEHQVLDDKKSMYQFYFGSTVECIHCGSKIKPAWVLNV